MENKITIEQVTFLLKEIKRINSELLKARREENLLIKTIEKLMETEIGRMYEAEELLLKELGQLYLEREK